MCFFFFQAEDGIRDIGVTGVQTCALPISLAVHLISTDGHAALLLVRMRGDLRAAVQAYPEVRSALASSVLQITITGKPAFLRNLDLLLERDLLRAELISFPLALIVLLMVFRTAVAALMPLLVGGLAVMTGVAAGGVAFHRTDLPHDPFPV